MSKAKLAFCFWFACFLLVVGSLYALAGIALIVRWRADYQVCERDFAGRPTSMECAFVPDYTLKKLYDGK